MAELLSGLEMREKLNALVKEHGGNGKAAQALGVQPTQFSAMRNGHRRVSKTLLEKLGYRIRTRTTYFYQKLEK